MTKTIQGIPIPEVGEWDRKIPVPEKIHPFQFDNGQSEHVAGSSHYQDAIKAAAGSGDTALFAVLVRETKNPYDNEAIKVMLAWEDSDGVNIDKAGYLPSGIAAFYGEQIDKINDAKEMAVVGASLVGGRAGQHWGVYLHSVKAKKTVWDVLAEHPYEDED